jgi:hypothetical protein
MLPESYVVRIYRRDRNRPDHMEGVLIAAEDLEGLPFHSGAELLRLLTAPARDRDEGGADHGMAA